MKLLRPGNAAATALACALILPAHAAPTLQTINGIVGGAGGTCASFVRATELSFFSFAPADVSVCGIATAGYSGGYRTQTATTGSLTQHDSLGPVILGLPQNSPGFYSGTADSRASYGSLGAASHSEISAPGTFGSPVALFDSVAAATFADTLTVISPLVVAGSNGTVRYRFEVDGSLSAPGAVVTATPGDTRMVLDLQHRGGKVSEVMNASVRRGNVGTISNRALPAGWTTSTGSLSGGSTFFSLPEAIVWGDSWDVEVGLLAWSYGTADSLFLSTARLTGFEFFDANGVAIADFSLRSASGTAYVNAVPDPNAVPEPSVAMLLLAGIGVMGLRFRRPRRASSAATERITGAGRHRESP